MAMYVAKVVVTALLVVLVSEVGKSRTLLGSMVVAVPWTSFLVLLWMRFEGVAMERISGHLVGTFWLVLPTLPFFLMLPWMVKRGWGFWGAFGISAALMLALYFGTAAVLKKTGWSTGL
jgi:hypothetical protein